MHGANKTFWKYVYEAYTEYFDEDILEVGSNDSTNTLKDLFSKDCTEHIGVDWRDGPNVDVVTLAHNMNFPKQFKAVVSASLLEHDPHWDRSIRKIIEYVRPDGILIMTWGAALNPPHCPGHATDGQFHALKGDLVRNLIEELGFTIVIWTYEYNVHKLIGKEYDPHLGFASKDGWGELAMVAFPSYQEPIYIDESLPQDKI